MAKAISRNVSAVAFIEDLDFPFFTIQSTLSQEHAPETTVEPEGRQWKLQANEHDQCRLAGLPAVGAADIYTGLGQLMVYSALLPRLAAHHRVLLLPALPNQPLVNAIAKCQVTLCTYDLSQTDGEISVSFSREFLKLCGLRRKKTS